MKKVIISVAVLLVLVVAIGWAVLGRGRNGADPAMEKKIEVVERSDFQMRISATGNLEPLLDVEVKAQVEGEVVNLHVDDGDYVEEGQVLVELDPELYQEELKQARADVSAAEAQRTQAELNIELRKERLESELTQADAAVKMAQANLETSQATTITQISQAETDIQTTLNALAQDEIELEQAKIAYEQAELARAEQESSLQSAKVNLKATVSELERNKSLYEKNLVSKKALEDAESQHANAVTQRENAMKRVESQQKTVLSRKRTISARESAISTRKATLEQQRINLENLKKMREKAEEEDRLQLANAETRLQELSLTIDNEKLLTQQSKVSADANLLRRQSSLKNQNERLEWTTIKAPMAGTVTLLAIEEGEIVTSGRSAFSQSPPLMTIADLSRMVVKTYINEVDMERLRLEQRAEIKVDAYQEKKYEGRVYEISPSGQEQDNIISFEVMIEVVGSPSELRPGMSADVDIITYEEKNVLLLPLDALIKQPSATLTAQVDDTSPYKAGQPIDVQTITEKIFRGTVANVGSGSVTISLDSSQRGIRPGPTTLSLLVKGKKKADGVRADIKMSKGKSVMLDSDDGPGTSTPVDVGMQNETHVIVKSGLSAGARVVLQQRKPQQGGWGK
ncbi:hypothetical protein C6495_05320 [Candidatus Poribacteria bacterium]|nr:MAG: hypothetical protein C6495_05320 [Candidatus Poribacteria bacterium]